MLLLQQTKKIVAWKGALKVWNAVEVVYDEISQWGCSWFMKSIGYSEKNIAVGVDVKTNCQDCITTWTVTEE